MFLGPYSMIYSWGPRGVFTAVIWYGEMRYHLWRERPLGFVEERDSLNRTREVEFVSGFACSMRTESESQRWATLHLLLISCAVTEWGQNIRLAICSSSGRGVVKQNGCLAALRRTFPAAATRVAFALANAKQHGFPCRVPRSGCCRTLPHSPK